VAHGQGRAPNYIHSVPSPAENVETNFMKLRTMRLLTPVITTLLLIALSAARATASPAPRERLSLDQGWRFAFGHATDVSKDFDHATGGFSYFAKAGFGSGASDPKFDDRGWRTLNLPHDWAVECRSANAAAESMASRRSGATSPKTAWAGIANRFTIPASDFGKRISLEFDGVFRDSIVWVNGHYLGTEESGYSSFARNLTEIPELRRRQRHRRARGRVAGRRLVLRRRGNLSARLAGENRAAPRRTPRHFRHLRAEEKRRGRHRPRLGPQRRHEHRHV
jgi:beta-galactosidase/beta-glucuronidase